MGLLDWLRGEPEMTLPVLIDKLHKQATALLAHNETLNQLLPSPQASHDLTFFKDFKKMMDEAKEDLEAGRTFPAEDVAHMRTLHKQFVQMEAAIAEGSRLAKKRLGI